MQESNASAVHWRQLIHAFIDERKQAKLDKLKPEQIEERQAVEQAYQPETWLADAARRVNQIQTATHTLKPVHPDARGTNLYVTRYPQHPSTLVGSHSIATALADDVVGNAAALDVYKLLKLEHNGQTLLQAIMAQSPAVQTALSTNAEHAQAWMQALAGITEGTSRPTTDTLAKQLFFPLTTGGYHLLAPLFPTSLVHHVHLQMREQRFGEAAKTARDAYKNKAFSEQGFCEYPNLVVQKFGGTKPQNISQLNSERYGENWLLPSQPPQWRKQAIKPPTQVVTIFEKWLYKSSAIRQLVRGLRQFLKKIKDYNNVAIREQRAEFVTRIVDEVLLASYELLELEAGWSAAADCRLDRQEALWLDPYRRFSDDEFNKEYEWKDWPEEIAIRFGNWLNAALKTDELLMGEAEAQQWQSDLDAELSLFRLEM